MQALRDRLHDKPAFAWLDHFRIGELGESQIVLEPLPGQRGLLRMVTEARKQQLAEHFGQLLGRSIRVKVQEPSEQEAADAAAAGAEASDSPAQAKSARQAAMQLPLVREAFEQFPNATLTDVQSGATPSPAAETESDSDTAPPPPDEGE
jgi:hypothetical protein